MAASVLTRGGLEARFAECANLGAMIGAMAAPRTRPKRRVGRPGHDVDSLLTVAVSLFNQRGYDRTSMEHLSAKLANSLLLEQLSGAIEPQPRRCHTLEGEQPVISRDTRENGKHTNSFHQR